MKVTFFKSSKFILLFTYKGDVKFEDVWKREVTYFVYISLLDDTTIVESVKDVLNIIELYDADELSDLGNNYSYRIVKAFFNNNDMPNINIIQNEKWESNMTRDDAIRVLEVYEPFLSAKYGMISEKYRLAKKFNLPYMYSVNGFTWEITEIEIK